MSESVCEFLIHRVAHATKNNYVTASLKEMGFKQIVTSATHISGGAIDHVYINQGSSTRFDWSLEYMPKYYSDHGGLGLTFWESREPLKKTDTHEGYMFT